MHKLTVEEMINRDIVISINNDKVKVIFNYSNKNNIEILI